MASNYLEGKLYDATLRNTSFAVTTVYLALHTAAPGETGANEVAGAGYARQAVAWGAPTDGVGTNSGTVTVPVPTSGGPFAVTHVGLWDAVSGGNFLDGDDLPATINAAAGDSIQWTAGQLTNTFT
jgi:hypothetical protein